MSLLEQPALCGGVPELLAARDLNNPKLADAVISWVVCQNCWLPAEGIPGS